MTTQPVDMSTPRDPDVEVEQVEFGRQGQRGVIIRCPHCRKRHVHGWPDGTSLGHRVAHCHDRKPEGRGGYYIVLTDRAVWQK